MLNPVSKELIRHDFEKHKFLVFDTETEHLNLRFARPWEIGWLVYQGNAKLEERQYYIKYDDIKLSKGAGRITNFNPQKLKEKGKDPKEVLDVFDSYIYNPEYKIVGSNLLRFDIFIHQAERLRHGKNIDWSYLSRIYDISALGKAMFLKNNPSDNFVSWQFSLANYVEKGLKTGIDAMCKHFKINIRESERHTVLEDCRLTFEVFKQLIWYVELK